MKKSVFAISFLIILSLILAGCNLPGQETPESQVDLLNTAAAQTIQAQQTLIAEATQVPPTQVISPTEALEPTEETEEATEPAAPTHTPTTAPTNTPQAKCDQAAFVSETVPDGTDFKPGEKFTKTWTLRNSGSCSWNADYDVVFFSGNALGASAATSITSGTVAPGQNVTVSLELTAPTSIGTHRGDFKLRNASGVVFGIGDKDSAFWVKIDVPGTAYDFTKNVCASGVKWTSGAGDLPCPGTADGNKGWVVIVDEPTLENLAVDDEPGIKVSPQYVNDGWIRGTYPEMAVSEGVSFRAIIGCYGAANCNVKFKLNARVDGGTEQTLATWNEVQDGKFNQVKVDLSSLAGKKVQFILLVEANGSPENDRALWFGPRIGAN